jgi:hypothetical protein
MGNDHARSYLHPEIWSHKASNKYTLEWDDRVGTATAFETRLRPFLCLHRLSTRGAALAPIPNRPMTIRCLPLFQNGAGPTSAVTATEVEKLIKAAKDDQYIATLT